MAVTVTSCPQPLHKKDFPKLMLYRHTGLVVLFHEHRKGTVVREGTGGSQVGKYSALWGSPDMNGWEDFNDPLTLQNS